MIGWPRAVLIGAVRLYRFALSPWLGSSCRFEPTCSAYALDALTAHGALAGSALTVGRLVRCHPFCAGGFDPVPAHAPRPFRSLVGRAPNDAHAPRASSEASS